MRRQNTPRRVKRNLLFGCIAERPESPAFVWRMQGMQVRMQMSRLFPVYPYTALKGSVFIPTYFSTSARFSGTGAQFLEACPGFRIGGPFGAIGRLRYFPLRQAIRDAPTYLIPAYSSSISCVVWA